VPPVSVTGHPGCSARIRAFRSVTLYGTFPSHCCLSHTRRLSSSQFVSFVYHRSHLVAFVHDCRLRRPDTGCETATLAINLKEQRFSSQATLYNGRLYMAGQLGLDPASMELVPGGAGPQIARALISCEAVAQVRWLNPFRNSYLSAILPWF
jgi:hypothetical protein